MSMSLPRHEGIRLPAKNGNEFLDALGACPDGRPASGVDRNDH